MVYVTRPPTYDSDGSPIQLTLKCLSWEELIITDSTVAPDWHNRPGMTLTCASSTGISVD